MDSRCCDLITYKDVMEINWGLWTFSISILKKSQLDLPKPTITNQCKLTLRVYVSLQCFPSPSI